MEFELPGSPGRSVVESSSPRDSQTAETSDSPQITRRWQFGAGKSNPTRADRNLPSAKHWVDLVFSALRGLETAVAAAVWVGAWSRRLTNCGLRESGWLGDWRGLDCGRPFSKRCRTTAPRHFFWIRWHALAMQHRL